MMELFVGLITAGFHFLLAYIIWGKGKVHILAGYVEGQVKDKKKLSKYAGILFIGLGIISVFSLWFRTVFFITYLHYIFYGF